MHSKLKYVQKSRYSRKRESLKYSLHRTLFNLDIFTSYVYSVCNLQPIATCVTLAYSELEAYSKPSQISIMENFIKNHV